MYEDVLYKIAHNNLIQEYYKYADSLPKPYCQSISSVKAIVLGTDPTAYKPKTNKSEIRILTTVFDLADNPNSRYFSSTLKNLKEVGLGLKDIYVDNLCKNYFTKTNGSIRKKAYHEAADLWIPILKKELDSKFNDKVIVFATSASAFEALFKIKKYKKPSFYYENNVFISPDNSKLGRTTILLSRHGDYKLENRKDYAEQIKQLLST